MRPDNGMLFVWQRYSKWSQDKHVKRGEVDWVVKHTTEFPKAAQSWPWSAPLHISSGWGDRCPKRLGFVVHKIDICRVISIQLTHWQLLCCKKRIYYYYYSHFEEFVGHSDITERVARKDWGSGFPSHCSFQSFTNRLHSKGTVSSSFSLWRLLKKICKLYERGRWVKKTTLPTHCIGTRVLVTPNAFQHAPFDSFHPNSIRRETHGDQTTHGCSAGWRQLDAVWRKKCWVLTTQQVLFVAAQNNFSKLFLLYCLGSKALKDVAEWTLPGDAWNGWSRHAMRNTRSTAACSRPWEHLSILT